MGFLLFDSFHTCYRYRGVISECEAECKNGVRGRERVEPGRREDMGRLGQHVVFVVCSVFFFFLVGWMCVTLG